MLHHANRASLITTRDPNFRNVTLLLHGDGTNGAQNNTFIDGSTNNFTITRNGNTTQGTFSPYGTLWSNYFDGNGDYLSIPDNAAFTFDGDFTVEAWVYRNASGIRHTVVAHWPGAVATNCSFIFHVEPTNYVAFSYGIGSTNVTLTGTSLTVPANQWTHIAATRSGSTIRFFVNGALDSNAPTLSGAFNNSTAPLLVGVINTSDQGYMNGYISNLRIVKGTAVYTANFTPPTEPLTAITNTSLLTCQSNRLIDNSSNAFTITRNGDVSVQRFSPFNPPGGYSTTIIGGSGYFDGTGDRLRVGANQNNLILGTSAFTIQAWIYRAVSGATHTIISKGSSATSTGFVFQVTSTNVLRFTHGTTNVDTTTTIPALAWTHVAAVRTSTGTNGFQLYINGVSSATATVATDLNQTDPLDIGNDRSDQDYMNGYISGIKYTNGTAESISVPTSPPTATTNVALLCNFTNASIIDNAMMNDLETVGNAQISTSVRRFGGSSMYFDGTGDWLVPPSSPNAAMGSGDFTWEAWVYFASGSTFRQIMSTRASSGTASTTAGSLAVNTSNGLTWFTNTTIVGYATSIGVNQWVHVAVSRAGTTLRVFANGIQVGSATNSDNLTAGILSVGANNNGSEPFNGYIDDLRITKGIARYTANFTPRNTPFPNM